MSASTESDGHAEFHAWNPGVQSNIPKRFLPLASIYRRENCAIDFALVRERAEFTGLDEEDLAVFRPERIALHSLLIRITANVAVSDGERYEDLGINFRRIAADLDNSYLRALMPQARAAYEALRATVQDHMRARLERILQPPALPPAPEPKGLAHWLPFLAARPAPIPPIDPNEHRKTELSALQHDAEAGTDEREQFCDRSLAKLLTSIATKHGRIVGDMDVLSDIATGLAMNVLDSKRIGELVEADFAKALQDAGYQLLPSQDHIVVLNTKGASASGKSTLRPLQRELTERLGVDWRDFALISPDIWRKYLIDYSSLGEAWRYAGSLSGHELKIVDRKLDLYMATRQQHKRAPHLLIDRFRFDSFQLTKQKKGEERLLTRFGDEVYMMFMVTPPEALVERAWKRGLEVGRFKPLDDLLDHCIEAYQGMPPLFFRWAGRSDKKVYYEFLDNSIAKGQPPRTIAFGNGGKLTVFSLKGMLDISRFARIDINAREPAGLWPKGQDYRTSDTAFIKQCAEHLSEIDFADAGSRKIYARLQGGEWQVLDSALLQRRMADEAEAMALSAAAPSLTVDEADRAMELTEKAESTLGAWSSDV